MKKTPILKTERLVMHSFRNEDLDDAVALLCNEEIKKTFMIPDFESREGAIQMFYALKDMSDSNEHFVNGIYLKEKLIGFINDVEIDGDKIEIGYVIHPDMKNKGYATEVLSASIQELFQMGYSLVRAGFFEENIASRRVMEKSGMHQIEQTEDIEYRGEVHHCIYFEIRNA